MLVAEGDVRKFEDDRLDKLGRGEVGPPAVQVDRRELVDTRFFKLVVDVLRSSRRELQLGVFRGVTKQAKKQVMESLRLSQ
ncbi:hypothetical protein DTO045G8_7195 [Paecilomyces variotii]|nr:hypothetical protein DTO045G8_7195 [Paecilomyces variotii]